MYNTILFDLDGTLTDPGEGITNSVSHALEKYAIHIGDKRELYKFIGPPLLDSFMKYYGFSHSQAEQAIAYYREYFRDKGIFENRVYDGVRQLLEEMKKENKKIVLATSKPEEFAHRILEHFGLLEYFHTVAGATMDSTRSKKGDIIAYALEKCGCSDKASCVMVGDREHDVIGAKENGLKCIGVLYGYGNRQELEKAGCEYIAENCSDILKFI